MADCGSELQEELEALEAIYIHELEVVKNDSDEVSSIILQLHPATGEEEDKKFVRMTLQLDLPENYPDTVPLVSIRNPRGIGDEEIHSLLEDMKQLASDRLGGPMLYELIELAKDSLTVGNIPHCLCMICLEHFFEGERFTRTDCYHYFHKSCLARYIQHFLSNSEETETKKLSLHMNQEVTKVQCPVCREEIGYDADSLTFSPIEEKFFFKPTEDMRQMQAEMAERLEKQRAVGGLIDVNAEKNKFLLTNDDVIQLPARPIEESVDRNKSLRDRRDNGKYSLRRNRDGPDRLDRRQENWRNKDAKNNDRRPKRDFDRPSSAFVKGKGRGKVIEEGNYNRAGGKDRNESSNKKERMADKDMKKIDSEYTKNEKSQLENTAKTEDVHKEKVCKKISDGNKTESTKSENEFLPSEEQDKELNKPRYDEKINYKHKSDNHKHNSVSKQKVTERSSEHSSQTEKSNNAGTAGSSMESFKEDIETAEIKPSLATEENDESETSSKDEDVKSSEKYTRHGGFGKPSSHHKDRKDHENKPDSSKDENVQRSEKHTDKKNSENKPENSKDKVVKSSERHKGHGGFGKPPFDYKDRKDSKNKSENSEDKNVQSSEKPKGRGGFGKPSPDCKSKEISERPDSGGEKPNDRAGHKDEKTISDGKYSKHYDKYNKDEYFHSGFEKRDKQYRDDYKTKKKYDRYDKSNRHYRDNDNRYGRNHSSSDKKDGRFYNAHERHISDRESDYKHDNKSDRNHVRNKKDEFDEKSDKNHASSDKSTCGNGGFEGRKHQGGFGKPRFDNRRNQRGKYHSDHAQSRNKEINHEPESWEPQLWEDIEPVERDGAALRKYDDKIRHVNNRQSLDEENGKSDFDRKDSNRSPTEITEKSSVEDEKQKTCGDDSNWNEKDKNHDYRNQTGFGEPNSSRKSSEGIGQNCDDWKDKESSSEFRSGKRETQGDYKLRKPRGGFSRPNPGRNPNENDSGDDSNWNEKDKIPGYRNQDRESSYVKKQRGGFGKPNSGFERKEYGINETDAVESQKPRNEFRNSDRKESPFSGHDRRHETYRNDYRRDYHKNEKHHISKNSDSRNWRENMVQPRNEVPGKHKHSDCDNEKDVSGGTKRDSYTREDKPFKSKENDRKCDIDAGETASRTENLNRQNCDTETDFKPDKTSHPPGFRVGPPPGFQRETKSAESIKPPPGF